LPERTYLTEAIKKNVNFVVKSLEIEDRSTDKPLQYVDEVKPDIVLRVHVVPDTHREMSFTMIVKIEGDLTAKQLGAPTMAFPKVKPMEDTTRYIDEIMARAEQIVQAISKTTRG
jgi:hypothetical protein